MGERVEVAARFSPRGDSGFLKHVTGLLVERNDQISPIPIRALVICHRQAYAAICANKTHTAKL